MKLEPKKAIKKTVLCLFSSLLIACHDADEYETYHHRHTDHYNSSGEYDHSGFPFLFSFDLIDTSGSNSADHIEPFLALNPYENSGLFEVLWEIDSHEDYWVEYRINNAPSLAGSQLINSDWCDGAGYSSEACGVFGRQTCHYGADFSLSCHSHFDPYRERIFIDGLMATVPITLYFILVTCDTFSSHCDYQSLPVLME